MPDKNTAYVSPNIAGILSLFDPALDWSADLSGDEYSTVLKEFLVVNQEGSKDPRKDPEIESDVLEGIREEYLKVRKNKDLEYSVKKTTIKGDKFMGKEPAKDAPTPITDPSKLLSGTVTTKPDDLKQAQIDESSEDKSQSLQPDILNDIAKSVESIATLLKRQLGVEKKQQRDAKKQQDRLNKSAREDKLEGKPKDKKTGLIPKSIAKPAIGFFGKIKDFIFNIGIGTALYKMHDWLTDPENKDKIGKFTDFLTKHAPLILGGLAALAVLPVLGGIMGTVGGIMGGLSALGLAVPLLPIILKGILIAAVAALAIAAVNWFAKKIVGGKGFSRARDLNKKRLLKAGINVKGHVKDDNGTTIYANVFGENSITGREWTEVDGFDIGGKSERVKLDIIDGTPKFGLSPEQHQEWYATNYGRESLDAKLAAHAKYTDTLAQIKSKQKEKDETLSPLHQLGRKSMTSGVITMPDGTVRDAYEASGLPRTPGGRLKMSLNNFSEYQDKQSAFSDYINETTRLLGLEIKKLEKQYNKEAMQIFNKSKEVNIDIKTNEKDQVSSSLENNNKNQLISFAAPGTGGDQNQAITEGGSDSSGTPYFGNRNLDTFTTADLYNLQTT